MPRTRIRGRIPSSIATGGSGGGTPIPAGAALIQDSYGSLEIVQAETNTLPTETNLSELSVTMAESNTLPVEALFAEIVRAEAANNTPTDVAQITLRYFATAASDNDSSRTTPANATGQTNGTVATVKTNNALGDLTNPVTLTLSSFGTPASLPGATITGIRIRVFTKAVGLVQAPGPTDDLIQLTVNNGVGSGDVVAANNLQFVAPPGPDYLTTGYVVMTQSNTIIDTLAELTSLSLTFSYTARVVAAPQGSLQVDAACIELDVTFP